MLLSILHERGVQRTLCSCKVLYGRYLQKGTKGIA